MAFLTRNDERISLFEAFLKQWKVLLSGESSNSAQIVYVKPPKAEPDVEKEAKSDDAVKPPSASPSSKSSSDPTKPPPDWNFGMFGPTTGAKSGGGQGQGKPIGGEPNPDQAKMFALGVLGFATFIGLLTYFEMGYKEISWKDFVNK